jgi:pimeloyl-ACP methyl ester carboxylesterase
MPMIDASGVKLHIEETGKGDAIVFVHEYGSDAREWETQVRHFSRSYRCIAYNARGYPPSEVPEDPERYGWEFARDDIAAVMRGLSIEKAHIVGLSMGGYAALQFAISYPQMARSVVAAGAGSGSPKAGLAEWRQQCAKRAAAIRAKGMGPFAEETGHGPTRIQLKRKDPRGWEEFMAHLRAHSALGMANTMARYQGLRPSLMDFGDALARLTMPVLLVVGDEDEPCLDINLFLKRTIPTAGLWFFPNTGHAVNLEEPAAFNAVVQDFLGAVEGGRWRRGVP